MQRTHTLAILLLVSLSVPGLAQAVDLHLEGYDRTRFYLYDTLSLDREGELSEENRAYFDQRLRLNPHLEVNPHVHVYGQLDALDLQIFGSDAGTLVTTGLTGATGDAYADPPQLTEGIVPPADYALAAVVKRVWGEIWTPYVDFRFGRMGNHWGMGVMVNDGNADNAFYGDTVDRVQVLGRIGPIQLSLAFDTYLEGLINEDDDIWGITFAGGFLSDVHSAGLYVHWRRMPADSWNTLYVDLWGRTRLGPLKVELEAALQYGKGNLSSLNIENAELLGGGGAFTAGIEILPFGAEFQLGLATGDKDLDDEKIHTFTFDRDYDIALLLFENPMPSFKLQGGGIDESQAVTGMGVANCFYVKPSGYIDPLDNVRVRLDFIAARQLVDPDPDLEGDDLHLAVEVDLGATWRLYENFELAGTVGVMVPGPLYEPYREAVFGTEIRGIIRF